MLRPTAIKVNPMPNYILDLEFDNGVKKVFDVKPYIKGEWYGELNNVDYFNKVQVNGYSVEWPNGQDLCPDEIYYG